MNRHPGRRTAATGGAGRATIADVARAAGASKTSVSRFLSGDPSALSAELRSRVQRAVDRLGYRPSRIARSLRGGRTGLIGLVVADIENPYSVAVLHGAEAACREAGYTLVLCNTGGDRTQERRILAALHSYSVEGLILNTTGWPEGLPPELAAPEVPVVLVDRRLPGVAYDFVGLDNLAATGLAVRHLAGQGFDRLALFAEPLPGVTPRLERAAGFCAAAARLPGCVGEVFEVQQDDPGAVDATLHRFLDAAEAAGQRSAVLAASGLVTLRVVQGLARLGLRFPQDVGLVGFDELVWSGLLPPGITTIAQPTHDIGARAVRMLLARLAGDDSPPRDAVYTGELLVRGSSRAGPGSGPAAGRPTRGAIGGGPPPGAAVELPA